LSFQFFKNNIIIYLSQARKDELMGNAVYAFIFFCKIMKGTFYPYIWGKIRKGSGGNFISSCWFFHECWNYEGCFGLFTLIISFLNKKIVGV
jgi:hypothetical protein